LGVGHGDHIDILSEGSVTIDSGTYPVVQVQVENNAPNPAYVLKRNVEPLTADELKPAISSCGPGIDGEVDRWIVSKDGTLKLKRFMVTSKCVNGQMRSFSKPLN